MNKLKEIFTNKRYLVKCVIILLFIAAILAYLYWGIFREVVNLLIASGILAYILRPIRDMIKGKRNISKKMSTLIVILLISITFLLIMVFAIPTLIRELSGSTPVIEELVEYLTNLGSKLKIEESSVFSTIYGEIEEKVWTVLMSLSEGIINGIANFMENIISFAIVPVVAYYILADGDNISNKISLIIPMEKRKISKTIAKDINKLLEKYIISQLVLSLATGIMCFIFFFILDLKFAFWLAIINGLFNIVPYFGAFFGGLPAVIIALLQSPTKGIWCIVGIILIQQIEGNLLAPKITADSTDIHPLIIIVLLLIGEKLGGILGMILIVPIGVIIKVIYDDIDHYLF